MCRAKCPMCRRRLGLVTDWVYVAAVYCPQRLDKRTLEEVQGSMRDGKGVVVIGDGAGGEDEYREVNVPNNDEDEGIGVEEYTSSNAGSESIEFELQFQAMGDPM